MPNQKTAPAEHEKSEVWLTLNEAAKLLREDRTTTIKRIKRGQLPASDLNADGARPTWRIRESDVQKFMGDRLVAVRRETA